MTRKQRRLWFAGLCLAGIGLAVGLSLAAFRQQVVFFVTPSALVDGGAYHNDTTHSFRLGGLVAQGSVHQTGTDADTSVQFTVTDTVNSIPVTYHGVLPDLFREGQGVVALGRMNDQGAFVASEVLAKHDENYMPKDVADALKKMGHWNPSTGAPPPPSSQWKKLLDASKASS